MNLDKKIQEILDSHILRVTEYTENDKKAMLPLARALVELRNKKYKLAKEIYNEALEFNSPQAFYMLGILKEADGNLEEAIEFYKKAKENGFKAANRELSRILEKIGKTEEAMQLSQKVAQTDEDIDAILNLAKLYRTEEIDLDRAIELYERAAELGNANAYFQLSNIYSRTLGDIKKGFKYLQKAVDLGDKEAIEYLKNLYE